MNENPEIYLGDGVYASFDGGQIWLRAPREEGDHVVALEFPVLRNLVDFARTCIRARIEAEKLIDQALEE